jgi:hypothetical protein
VGEQSSSKAVVTLGVGAALFGVALLGAVVSSPSSSDVTPRVLAPESIAGDLQIAPNWNPQPIAPLEDLTAEGAIGRGTVAPTIIDTRDFPVQRQITGPYEGPKRISSNGLRPPHTKPDIAALDESSRQARPSVTRGVSGPPIVSLGRGWTGITQTAWTPPDPTLAVGPNHVVITVNQSIAWYTKDGVQQFSAILGNQGNPGFFENEGALDFTFDPKCFYDHLAGRYVVLALEVYGTFTATETDDEATITFAVSDDDDPNGIWFKYRTNAIIDISGDTFWWDYPGFGYDGQAYYVTGNLFGLNNGGFAGAGFRAFDKTPLLTGSPTTFTTVRDSNVVSVQVAQHFSPTTTPYFLSAPFLDNWRIVAMNDPLGSPSLSIATIPTGFFDFPPDAPTPGGNADTIDPRVFNVNFRNGKLYGGHNVDGGSGVLARWLEFDLNGWPAASFPTLAQSGTIDVPGEVTFEPAVFTDATGNVGYVFASSSPTENIKMQVTARRPGDALGMVAEPVEVAQGSVGSNGRWGDYYDICVDPVDDATFWAIGQTSEGFGWSTFVQEFNVPTPVACPGDINGDNMVTLADFNILAANFGGGPGLTLAQGDLSGDGFVNLADFTILANNFGRVCP